MAVVQELIRTEDNGTISFGNYELNQEIQIVGLSVSGRYVIK